MVSDGPVTGLNKNKHRLENKKRRQQLQSQQPVVDYWKNHKGEFSVPTPKGGRPAHHGSMCPARLALLHPAADILLEPYMNGCPTKTGKPWMREEVEEAIKRGSHVSALIPEAMKILNDEVKAKVDSGQARLIIWDDIKRNLPPELKVSPIAMIPHKSRLFWAILDLSFRIRLECGREVPAVNESSEKTAPKGAIDQLGYSLHCIIHTFHKRTQRPRSS